MILSVWNNNSFKAFAEQHPTDDYCITEGFMFLVKQREMVVSPYFVPSTDQNIHCLKPSTSMHEAKCYVTASKTQVILRDSMLIIRYLTPL